MRAMLSIDLVNKESMFFFSKETTNGDTICNRVMRKVNSLIKESINYNACALIKTYELDEKIKSDTDYLFDEIDKFEGQLEKRKPLGAKKIRLIARFKQELPCSNPMAVTLIEWFETFDKLISTLKLLNLNGCFESKEIFQHVQRRYQKKAKRLLSSIIFEPATSLNNKTIQEIIKSESSYDWGTLYKAMSSQFCPGFSKQLRHQLLYQVKSKLAPEKTKLTQQGVIQ